MQPSIILHTDGQVLSHFLPFSLQIFKSLVESLYKVMQSSIVVLTTCLKF